MAARFIEKVGALAEILNLPGAGGIGIYQGKVYVNLNGNISAIANAPAFGSVLLVDGDNGSATDERLPYSTIQAAVADASQGDTIVVRPLASDTAGISAGTAADPPGYVGGITIPPALSNLSIVGAGGGLSQISQACIRVGTTTTNPLITVQAVGVLIANLTINGSGGTGGGIKLDAVSGVSDAGGLVVAGCHFKGCHGAATAAGRGGAIWFSGGGSWYVTIAGNDFYSNRVGIALIGSSSVSVPKDLKILGNRFYGASADIDCDIDLIAGGDGVNGLVIDGNVFACVDVPSYATGTGYKSRYLDLTGCTNGILSSNSFSCAVAKLFKSNGDAALIPATVRMAGNHCEGSVATSDLGLIGR